MGLKGLNQKLQDMKAYLEKVQMKFLFWELVFPSTELIKLNLPFPQVVAGELPMNHEITYQLQDIFNLLPDVTNPVFVRSLQVLHTQSSPWSPF